LPFCILKKTIYVKTCLGLTWAKLALFYEILSLNIVLLICFEENLAYFHF